MTLNLLLIFVFSFFIRCVFLVDNSGSDNWVHLFYVKTQNRIKSPFKYEAYQSVLEGKKAYPQLYHFLISFFPQRYCLAAARFANIVLDCIQIIVATLIAFAVFSQIEVGLDDSIIWLPAYVGLILATSPILLPVTARMKAMGARVFGQFLFLIFLYFNFMIVSGYFVFGSIGFFVTLMLIVLSSQFALQASIWSTIIISIGYYNPFPFIALVVTIGFAWKCVYWGTYDLLNAKIEHWRWYFHNSQTGTGATGRNRISDHLRLPFWLVKDPQKALRLIFCKSVPLIVLYSVLPVVILVFFFLEDIVILQTILSYPVTKFLFWVTIAAASACCLSSLKPLLFLGEAERYLEYAVPAIAILYVFAVRITGRSEAWLVYMLFFQLIGVHVNYLYGNRKILFNSMLNNVEERFREVAWFFDKNNNSKKVITIPTKLSFRLATETNKKHLFYYRFVYKPKFDNDYMENDHVAFELLKPDFEYFRDKYGIDTVVVSKTTLVAAKKQNINYYLSKYRVVFENAKYMVLDITESKDQVVCSLAK